MSPLLTEFFTVRFLLSYNIYLIIIIAVLLGLTQSTYCIILAIIFAFPLIEHFSMKGRHPMYKFEEENSEKTYKESQVKV